MPLTTKQFFNNLRLAGFWQIRSGRLVVSPKADVEIFKGDILWLLVEMIGRQKIFKKIIVFSEISKKIGEKLSPFFSDAKVVMAKDFKVAAEAGLADNYLMISCGEPLGLEAPLGAAIISIFERSLILALASGVEALSGEIVEIVLADEIQVFEENYQTSLKELASE